MSRPEIVWIAVAGLALGCSTPQSASLHSKPTAPSTVNVVLNEFSFDPNPLKVAAGQVRFLLKNRGTVEHDFMIPGLMGHADHSKHLIQPGQSRAVEVDLKPGVYEAICTVPGHKESGMKATIEAGVEAGSSGEH